MKYIYVLCIYFFIMGGDTISEPKIIDAAKIKVQTEHSLEIVTYQIPNGIFRGALWPTKDNPNFQIWVIINDSEKFFNIKPPQQFKSYKSTVTKQWQISLLQSNGVYKNYLLNKKNGTKKLEIMLPNKKREYTFSVIENQIGNELIVFMDLSEEIEDLGLFGYVTIIEKS